MKSIRLGVVGLGLIWLRVHQPLLAAYSDVFEIAALCDVSEARRATATRDFPSARVCSSYEELLQTPGLDAVLVLTPLALNATVARAALAAGLDVIMEKPIARSVAEGRDLMELAQAAGKRLLVTEQFAYRAVEELLLELIASNAIGDVILWDRVQHVDTDSAQGELRYESTPWRKTGDYPLGVMFDGGIHRIAALSRIFGAPQAVNASGRQLRPDFGEYDHVAIMFHYASGLVGMFSYATCLTALQDYHILHGAQGVITVESGRITLKRMGEADRVLELPPVDDYARMWQALVTSLRSGGDPPYSAAMALREVAILEAVEKSIKRGERVRVSSEK